MRGMAKTSLLSGIGQLLLFGLGVRRRHGSVVLPQLGRAREGVWCYRRRSASVPCAPSLPTVVSLHVLALLVWLRRRILVGIGRIWHCNGGGRLGDWRKYLSHRDLVTTRLSRLDRGRLVGAVDKDDDLVERAKPTPSGSVSSGTLVM